MSRQLFNINGILLLDKPMDISSNYALQRAKRLFCAKKAGHTGSLDPLATGMLPLCFGESTKFSQYLLESNKTYRVVAKLGVRTNTADSEGDVIETRSIEGINSESIEKLLPQFIGNLQQVPPMFSAIKFQGQPLYKLARQGIEIERKARSIHIYSLQMEGFHGDTASFVVHCSKGTYIRTLVEDIGEALGCGAHVCGLRRVSVSPYEGAPMYTFEELDEINQRSGSAGLLALLLPMDTAVHSFPAVHLTMAAAFYARQGHAVKIPPTNLATESLIRLLSPEGTFMGMGELLEDGRVKPFRMIAA